MNILYDKNGENMKKLIGRILFIIEKIEWYFKKEYIKSQFIKFGNKSYIGKNCIFTPHSIEIGEDTYIGPNAIFRSSFGTIKIGNHVMFGPGVHIHGGNHRFHEIGKYMKDISSKAQGDDGKIIIEDDCWIGANAIILSNVTIGKGSIVGAGSIVTKNIPPYSIYTGSPEKKLRKRFNDEEVIKHEKLIKFKEK